MPRLLSLLYAQRSDYVLTSSSRNVAQHILQLAATMQEGVEHIQQQQARGQAAELTVPLFMDVVTAFTEIEFTMTNMLPVIENNEYMTEKTDALRDALASTASAYEGASDVTPLFSVEHTLLPCIKHWYNTLHIVLGSQIAASSS